MKRVWQLKIPVLNKPDNRTAILIWCPCKCNTYSFLAQINSQDDQGLLVGNWSGDYDGGSKPTSWDSSTAILLEYKEKGEPVKFGQCWVFSHVMTAGELICD